MLHSDGKDREYNKEMTRGRQKMKQSDRERQRTEKNHKKR